MKGNTIKSQSNLTFRTPALVHSHCGLKLRCQKGFKLFHFEATVRRNSPVVDERPRGRETFLKPPQSPSLRRRCKSLPTPTERAKLEISRSRSPTSQKKVRFADSLGLELISVKHFDDSDEPEVPERILAKLPKSTDLNHMASTKFPRPLTQSVFMELQFTTPGTLPGFEQKVREVKVLLESVETDDFSLSGFVRVLNLAFEKSVSLRYSLNNWITFMDSLASYVPHSSDGATDRFSFKVVMPTYMENGGTLQFAIKYTVDGEEFWDNNNGKNYKVRPIIVVSTSESTSDFSPAAT
uniref:CBM21 domain-containing protein n=1 Tax=Hippocampus comes TaxID=109280 RepID=A0A3Q2YGE1_HIPCM